MDVFLFIGCEKKIPSRQEIISRYSNGEKKIVVVYEGIRINEKIIQCNRIEKITYSKIIVTYFFRFYYYNNQESIVNKLKIYDYYELNKDEEHNDICMKKKIPF